MKFLIKIIIISVVLLGCRATRKTKSSSFNVMDLKNVVVYKSKSDYSNNVPIMYSKELGSIISYPAPTDVERFKELKPIELSEGYLLDQIGVNLRTVYLEYSLDEYSEFREAPSLETMTKKILEYSPFVELYDIGQPNEKNNSIDKLNKLIKSGEMEAYRQK